MNIKRVSKTRGGGVLELFFDGVCKKKTKQTNKQTKNKTKQNNKNNKTKTKQKQKQKQNKTKKKTAGNPEYFEIYTLGEIIRYASK